MLAHTGDIYDGIAVDAEKLPDDPAEFSELLEKSLEVRHFTLSSFTCCSASQMPIAKLADVHAGNPCSQHAASIT